MTTQTLPARPRLNRLFERRDGDDFPFYNEQPTKIATWKWLTIIASCVVGYFVVLFTPAPNDLWALIPRTLFSAIPLITFIVFTGRYWTRLFRRPSWRDVGAVFVFAAIDLVVIAAFAVLIRQLFGANANPATSTVLDGGPLNVVAFYLGTGIQFIGEELFTILPFLAIVYWLHEKAKLSRNAAVVIAWLVTAVWFGAAHLPTYGWNVIQALLLIGGARLILTLAYIRTKNLGVAIGAHLINDWVQFTVTLAVAAAATAAA